MFKKPLFWTLQGVSVAFGGLLASIGYPKGDYLPAVFVTIIMSLCLTALLLLEKH